MSVREAYVQTLVQSLGERMLAKTLDVWKAMFGLDASCRAAGSEDPHFGVGVDELLASGAALMATRIEVDALHSGPILFLFSGAAAMELVGEAAMLPEPGRAERLEQGLQESDLETFRELAGLACAAANQVTRRFKSVIRVSQAAEDLVLCSMPAGSDPGRIEALPEGPLYLARLTLNLADGRVEPCLVALPKDLAWQLEAALRNSLRRSA